VKLQRVNARKTEKLGFMEEHASQLVAELQKKTRIVQYYVMREQSGALSSASMDQNKVRYLPLKFKHMFIHIWQGDLGKTLLIDNRFYFTKAINGLFLCIS
jgi:hypothetical protein